MSSTMTKMLPTEWRTLNALFYRTIHGGEYRADQLMRDEDTSASTLCALQWHGLIKAQIWGDTGGMMIVLTDLDLNNQGMWRKVSVRLTSAGNRKVVGTPANNVICMLGGRSGQVAPARAVRTEGEADDELLRAMEEEGLIEASVPLKSFKQIPRDLPIKLTRKGRQYYPNR